MIIEGKHNRDMNDIVNIFVSEEGYGTGEKRGNCVPLPSISTRSTQKMIKNRIIEALLSCSDRRLRRAPMFSHKKHPDHQKMVGDIVIYRSKYR